MRRTANIISGIAALAGVAAAMTLSAPFGAKKHPEGKSKVTVAIDTLEQQLQRRFHDRNNITFGYGRVVRFGARDHLGTVMNIIPRSLAQSALRDDGQLLKLRGVGGNTEVEISDGVWVPIARLKDTLHPENDAEKGLVETLKNSAVAIYTVGEFDSSTGKAARLMGPAYTRLTAPDAPAKEAIADLAATAWVGKADESEVSKDGWTYRIVKVKADDKTCISCHEGQATSAKLSHMPYKLNEPLGTFVIGLKG